MITRVATLFVFSAGWIPVFRYRSEHLTTKLAAASAAEQRWIPITVVVVSFHVSLAQLLLTLPLLGLVPVPAVNETPRFLLGIAIYVAGLALWFWARRSLGPLDRFVDTVNPPTQLLVSGPFGIVRHPLALGTILCALGPAVATGAPITWLTFAASAFCVAKRCLQDEDLLWTAFGTAYGAYAARTRRLLPFVW
ncbi:MAG: isoprenylcysteine carboxylmethyltransferase family protein [Deltaproteobacteria bacterium]|nr:isoprenylcysteine carboxylmethyltransferase family protein [Deltaproteobacteria bacterium]